MDSSVFDKQYKTRILLWKISPLIAAEEKEKLLNKTIFKIRHHNL